MSDNEFPKKVPGWQCNICGEPWLSMRGAADCCAIPEIHLWICDEEDCFGHVTREQAKEAMKKCSECGHTFSQHPMFPAMCFGCKCTGFKEEQAKGDAK